MASEDRGEVEDVHKMVAVGDGVHAVFREAGEAHVGARELAVERQGGTGQRAAAERRFVDGVIGGKQALRVAHKGLRVGHPELPHRYRLRLLKVRVAGNDDVGLLFGLFDKHGYQRLKTLPDAEQLFAQV
ncbi:hypothetical protein SDC9_136634 [bioreactor metagenome]|uniref:Uncharacterized protein n=1 Tax=bioreactor metagenome TaxID=1076179 RepID=A0A645DJT3_9ZZZZ